MEILNNVAFKKSLLLSVVSFFFVGCSSSYDAGEAHLEAKQKRYEMEVEKREQTLESVPDWFIAPLKANDSGFYSVGLGEATSMSSAIRKAEIRALADLAANVSQLVTRQEKMFSKSTLDSDGETMQSAIELFINQQDVAGTEFDKKVISIVGDKFVVYVRAFLPVKEIQAAKERAQFAKDLELDSKTAQLELMNRVQKAQKQAEAEKAAETALIQAQADKKAAALVEQQLAQ